MDNPSDRASIREGNERAILAAAESVFAEHGFAGAAMAQIAARAGAPKPNVHCYFPTKAELYRAVIDEALTAYIEAKMDLAREMPPGSRIWASEIIRGAPFIQDFLETTLRQWAPSREAVVRRWIAEGRLQPIEPIFLFYMIWAATQHYANAAHEIATLENGRARRGRVRTGEETRGSRPSSAASAHGAAGGRKSLQNDDEPSRSRIKRIHGLIEKVT